MTCCRWLWVSEVCLTRIAKFALLCLLVFFSIAAKAQSPKRVQLSIGPDVGLVTGSLSKTHSVMLGGSVQVGVPINKNLFFTVAGGYNYFAGKSNRSGQPQNTFITDYIGLKSVPAKLGLKYHINTLIYLQGEAGAAFFSGTPQTSYEAGTAFLYAPQIGVELPAGRHSLKASLRYESTIPKANNALKVAFVGLHLGFGF